MELLVNTRTVFGKPTKLLRKQSIIPGIIYGRHLTSTLPVSFDKNTFLKVYKQSGESTVINLTGDQKLMVLIQDYQVHPVSNELLHVDFLAVKSDEKVEADVKIIFVGESPVIKNKLGTTQIVKDFVSVSAFPQDLPHHIEVDLSVIVGLDDGVFVKDLKLGDKVEIKDDMEAPLVVAVEIKEEKEDAPVVAASAEATKTEEKK